MDAPNGYKNAGMLLIVSGAVNILTATIYILSLIWICVGIFWFVPLGLGVFQIIVGLAMKNGEVKDQAKLTAILGMVGGLLNLNPVPAAISALAMAELGKPEVLGWIEQRKQG